MLARWVRALRDARDTIVWKAPPRVSDDAVVFNSRDIVHELDAPPDWDLLIDGIERALAGDDDPFRLRQRGRKPTYKTADLVRAVATVKLLRKRGESLEDARAHAAEKTGIGEETIRDAMRNDVIEVKASVLAALLALRGEESSLIGPSADRQSASIIREHAVRQ